MKFHLILKEPIGEISIRCLTSTYSDY